MAKKKYIHHQSTIVNSERIKQIIRDNFEPGRQDKSKIAIYRNKIKNQFGIDERTFWRYMHDITQEKKNTDDPRQMKIF